MSKHTIKGFITAEKYSWEDAARIGFQTWKPGSEHESQKAVVSEYSFEVDVPDDFNPLPQQVAALEEKKRLIRLKLGKELAAIDDEISKLTCLTNEVSA